MTLQEMVDMLSDGHIFFVVFVKRSDGTVRKMSARTGVKKGVKGIGLKFDPAKKDLLSVYDCRKQQFRFIPLDSIISISHNGRKWTVINGQFEEIK